MMKVIFVMALSLSAMTANAQESLTCSCQKTFEDFLGNEFHQTVHVICPTYTEDSEIGCSAAVSNNFFNVTCKNNLTEVENTTSINLEPGMKPSYGYTYCQLN